jgi:hypothetical protein
VRGDLHAHTVHSDGLETVEAVVARARSADLEFLAITDHNTISHHAAMASIAAPGLVLIPGQEVTTPLGHLNVWGPVGLDLASGLAGSLMAGAIEEAQRAGAICSINHPKSEGPPWRYRLDLPVNALEVWQTHWSCHNAESLALWDRELVSGRRLPAVGGSDYHGPVDPVTALRRIGWPTTWVRATAQTPAAILDAIRRGHACVSAHPAGPWLDLQAWGGESWAGAGDVLDRAADEPLDVELRVRGGTGGRLRLVGDGAVLEEVPVDCADFSVRCQLMARRYVRAELLGELPAALRLSNLPLGWDDIDSRLAISNPIYVQLTSERSD